MSSPNHSQFHHPPLSGPFRTRLIWLSPSLDANSPIQCQIAEAPLAQMPPYEALSYAWDSHEGNATIQCFNGTNQILQVTRNCERALKRLRLVDHPRILWVDAICIDQTSDKDKETQIPLMKDIYTLAQRVVLWIGNENRSTRNLFDQMEAAQYFTVIPTVIPSELLRCCGSCAKSIVHIPSNQNNQILNSEGTGGAHYGFFSRAPFERMWCVQELVLGRQVLVVCGSRSLDWDFLSRGLNEFTRMNKEMGMDAIESRMRPILDRTGLVTRFRGMLHDPSRRHARGPGSLAMCGLSLADVVEMARMRGASVSHDKVYALHGLLGCLGIQLPPPEYRKPIGNVFREMAIASLHVDRNLNLLYLVTGSQSAEASIASWVPDLTDSHPPLVPPIRRYQASGGSQPGFDTGPSQAELVVWAKIIGHVGTTGDAMPRFSMASSPDPTAIPYISAAQSEKAFVILKQWAIIAQGAQATDLRPFSSTLLLDAVMKSALDFPAFQRVFNALHHLLLTAEPREVVVDRAIASNLSYIGDIEGASDQHLEFALQLVASQLAMLIGAVFHEAQQPKALHYWLMLMLRRRKFFLAHLGGLTQMGLGTEGVESGDSIMLVQGLNTPMIARLMGKGNDGYDMWKLLGPAFVYGVMNAELWNEGTGLFPMKLV
ncbi:uncharacterized protein MKZ38_004426 [Zalerion maritima]|uniref:Heterokaryon incompatibility domain-containing protein n=1 Tax=Zalerion maritima TaxID=339359 RepID=A0AAD5RYK6_9PEZI|nr:uncharacterized protein MKZ38_004426 [Zalerion maritima]